MVYLFGGGVYLSPMNGHGREETPNEGAFLLFVDGAS
jgi:hypothetical protein